MSPILFLLASTLAAAPGFEYWPGANYDPRIPTFRAVLGHDPGERITQPEGIVRYLRALEGASRRIKVFEYGESWERRKLVFAAVGSEANIRRLDEIRSGMARLADPRKTSAAEASKLMATLPAVVWLSYGVHGNEISSPDAAMLTAYHLLAARGDKTAERILERVVVLIDPLQNPDGRQRFVNHFEQNLGLEPDASQAAAEHNEQWPGGRSNHYLFDLNRDWIALTQPEVSLQVKALLEWLPLVYVDLHEMGSDTTYYFAPEADPYNPHLVDYQRETLKIFGRNNARWFDRFGFDYFTREVYDAFYPGYGASWPAYYGAVAMTYEQASVRGLVVRRRDGTVMQFRDTVRRHFVASLSTAEAAAENRDKLLADFYHYRVTAVEEGGREAVREYILPRGRDFSATDKLAAILAEQGVEVRRATAPFRAGDRQYGAGTYLVSAAQPAKRLIRNLLDTSVAMDEKFLKAEEERRRRKLRTEIYDVTAWSLPLMFNVECVARAEASQGSFEAVRPARVPPGKLLAQNASVAWLVPWGNQAAGRLLAAALREDLKVLSSDKPFTLNGTEFPSGTLIFKVQDNPAGLRARLARLAESTGAVVHGTDTGWVEAGVNFGSRYVFSMKKPAVAMAWDQPTRATEAGATRFVLERQYGYPVTTIRTAQLGAADLGKFQVVILPAGATYAQTLNTAAIDKLKAWVDAGGTLIGLAEGTGFLADKKTDLLALTQEDAARETDAKKPAEKEKEEARPAGKLLASEEDFRKAIRADKEAPDSVPGVLARARLDGEHWLTAGAGETVVALVEGRAIFAPIKQDKGVNAAYFEAPGKLLASGYLWKENQAQLAYKPLVVVQPRGRGFVIGFTQDPNFRAYLDGLNTLFLNAVFRGPAHAR
jgi:putative intracellular protease/amidase